MSNDARDARVRKALGGQSAPPSHDGRGQQLLFHCPDCQQYGLVDGRIWYSRIEVPEAVAIAKRLRIDLAQALAFTCKPCLRAQGRGLFEIDEYFVAGLPPGFGLSWEGEDPPGAHALCLILPLALVPHLPGVAADVPTQIPALQRTLNWLRTATPPAGAVQRLPTEFLALLVFDNPPGHGAPRTADWRWEGCVWSTAIAGVPHLIQLCQAMPPGVSYDPWLTIRLWQVLAASIA